MGEAPSVKVMGAAVLERLLARRVMPADLSPETQRKAPTVTGVRFPWMKVSRQL